MGQQQSNPVNETKVCWQYQIEHDIESKEWKSYPDSIIKLIENAYEEKEEDLQLEDSQIHYQRMMEETKTNLRPIRRRLIHYTNELRPERFCSQGEEVYLVNDNEPFEPCQFADGCFDGNKLLSKSEVIEKSANRILLQGKMLSKEIEAQYLADQLLAVKDELSQQMIGECCAYIYTTETFLYKIMNQALKDRQKMTIDTWKSFCHLLELYIFHSDHYTNVQIKQNLIVYRAAYLTNRMIRDYEKSISTNCIQWSSFTSTTKDRNLAEKIPDRNTLFVIQLEKPPLNSPFSRYEIDLSAISDYPNEQEVLLSVGYKFFVDKIERQNNDKYIIYLRSAIY